MVIVLDNIVSVSMTNSEYVFDTQPASFMMSKSSIIINYERKMIMNNMIPTPTLGEILSEEFMEPLGISAYKLAKDIHVPTSRIQDILHNRRKITADTSLRFAKYFGVSDRYFLDMQNDLDIRELKIQISEEISKIPVFQSA